MCSKFALFAHHSLDEKTAPEERFLQALDERGADGLFRTLLTKHFSENWILVFSSADSLEDTLETSQSCPSDAEKCRSFLLAKPVIKHLRFDPLFIRTDRRFTPRVEAVVDFARDVVRECFPWSSYDLYSSELGKALSYPSYHAFLSAFYGEDFCFSKLFFDNEMLTSLEPDGRIDFLWREFQTMVGQTGYLPRTFYSSTRIDFQAESLISVASLSLHPGAPTQSTREFLRSIGFLKAWVMHDVKSGRLSGISNLLESKFAGWYYELRNHLYPADTVQEASAETVEIANKWLCNTRCELATILYLHADLTNASAQDRKLWANGLEEHFNDYSPDSPDQDLQWKEIRSRKFEYLRQLCSQLTPSQMEAWVQWTFETDFKSAMDDDSKHDSIHLEHGNKWWGTNYADTYAEKFEEALRKAGSENRLRLLSKQLSVTDLVFATSTISLASSEWWNRLFVELINETSFPKQLRPRWVVAAKRKGIDRELWTPYLDDSIGILRGEISSDGKAEHHEDLNELLTELENTNPTKTLRHRLMLIRSSLVPFADESISRFNSISDGEKTVEWDMPMSELAKKRVRIEYKSRRPAAHEEREAVEIESLTKFCCDLAEFCLSRLRLRKGEKAKDGKYDSRQVVERSPAWRRGYLKALTELGIDLNGKAHKAVYFIQQSDPDKDIRDIAKECYRSVRRHSKKQRSLGELKRSIIAAEWWLLLCQRIELELDVNNDEALKTRRRQLRHLN